LAIQPRPFSAKVVLKIFQEIRRLVNIPYYIVYKKYRTSWIRATDKFIDGKISDLAESNPQYAIITDRIEN